MTPSGEVQTAERGQYSHVAIGQLNLSLFHSPGRLVPMGNGCFQNNVDSGQAISSIPGEYGAGQIAQGWLERETPRWTLEGNVPILMLLICVTAAAIQISLTWRANRVQTAKISSDSQKRLNQSPGAWGRMSEKGNL